MRPHQDGVRAGAAQAVISPEVGEVYLAAGPNCRVGRFRGIHDDLMARTLVIEAGGERVALVSCDLIGLDRSGDLTRRIRERAGALGLAEDSVMVTATHTHCAPDTIGLSGAQVGRRWQDLVVDKVAEALRAAAEGMVRARPTVGSGKVYGVTTNRRILCADGRVYRNWALPFLHPEVRRGPTDPTVGVLAYLDEQNQPLAIVVHFAAHAVVAMGSGEVSADYPGVVASRLEGLFGCPVLFLNGAAGDVNPPTAGSGFREAARVGMLVADAAATTVVELQASLPAPCEPSATARATQVELEHRPGLETTEASNLGPTETAEIQVMDLGAVLLAGFPGELFSIYGYYLQAQFSRTVWVAGYANQWLGYFATPGAYEEGGYEVEPAPWNPFPPGTAERLCHEAATLLAASPTRAGEHTP